MWASGAFSPPTFTGMLTAFLCAVLLVATTAASRLLVSLVSGPSSREEHRRERVLRPRPHRRVKIGGSERERRSTPA
jgi:hypothetical protein